MTRIRAKLSIAAIAMLAATVSITAQTQGEIDVEVHIIGFDVDAKTEQQLREMAAAAGGQYHSSANSSELTRVLGEAAGVQVSADPNRPQLPTNTAEQEPNNRGEAATAANPNGTFTGAFDKKGDEDFYIIDVDRPGQWTINLSGPTGYQFGFGVFPASGGGWLSNHSEDNTKQMIADLPYKGRYIFKVSEKNRKHGSGPYQLTSQFIPAPDSAEPNARGQSAFEISGNTTITAAILPKGDEDHYFFNAPQPGELVVKIDKQPAGFNLALGAFPAFGGGWLSDRSGKGDGKLVVDLPYKGRYILKVHEGNSKRSVDPYQLGVKFTPSPDKYEPNNRGESAFEISGDTLITATILPKGDEDFYRFNAPKAGELTINIDKQPDGFNLALGVFSANGGGWLSDRSEKGDGKLVVDLPYKGNYILKAHDANAKRSVEPYGLNVKFIASPDSFESNNRGETAASIPGSGEILATIEPAGDEDHFIFDAPGAGEWAIVIAEQPENWHISLGVYPANGGGWLSDRSEKGDGKLVVDLPYAGRYILKASEANSKRSVAPYKLALAFTLANDVHEPNNKPELANVVPASGVITATMLPAGDQDNFYFDAPSAGKWTIEVTSAPKNMTINMGVYPAAGGGWMSDKSEKGDKKLVVDIPAPGRYILRTSEANSKRSATPYELRLQFQ